MPSENTLTQIRRAFMIPDSVLIYTGAKLNIGQSQIGKQPDGGKYNVPQGTQKDAHISMSALNTPVYSDINFLPKTYTDSAGRQVTTKGQVYEAVLITVSQAKKIIRTEIQGRDGTVPEYIGLDDFQVVVNGIITKPNGVHPTDEIADLKKMLDAPVEIDVACAYLQNLGIQSLICLDYTFEQQAGGYSYQTFSITFSSFIPQQLRLNGI
jgi:hypothetical protein